jgi:hypothetical protein
MKRTTCLAWIGTGMLLVGCGRAPHPSQSEELVLQSYPGGDQAEELAGKLSSMLKMGESRVGTASATSDGQVLVLAPRSVQAGLAEAIEAQQRDRGSERPREIVTTYWLVTAKPAVGEGSRGERLGVIQAVLDEVAAADGPQDFRLLERVELGQADGAWAQTISPKARIEQKASVSQGRIILWVRSREGQASPQERSLETTLNLEDGQFVVVGQASFSAEGTTLYTIVRARTLASS